MPQTFLDGLAQMVSQAIVGQADAIVRQDTADQDWYSGLLHETMHCQAYCSQDPPPLRHQVMNHLSFRTLRIQFHYARHPSPFVQGRYWSLVLMSQAFPLC